eukprot:sb/3466589/
MSKTRRQSSAPGTLNRNNVAVEVEVYTDKDHFLPGEKLTGKIYVVAKESVRVDKLVAVIEGFNNVAWEEDKRSIEYAEDVKLFEERVLVRSFSKPIPVGRFYFDFSYLVPEFLPSSFNVDTVARNLKWEDIRMHVATVNYSIRAVLERSEEPVGKVSGQPFIIHAPPEKTETVVKEDITEQVKTFGCFPRGYITVSLTIDKASYKNNDVMTIRLEVTNMTPLPCKNIIAVLFRKLKVLAQRSQRNIRTKEYMIEFEDVPSGERATYVKDVQLKNVLPTTCSRNIKCNYVLAVRCEVPFSTNIDLTLPVTTIIAPSEEHEQSCPPLQLYKPWKD